MRLVIDHSLESSLGCVFIGYFFFFLFPPFSGEKGGAKNAGAPKLLLPAPCLLVGFYKDSEPTRRHAALQQGLPLHPRGAPPPHLLRGSQEW